ncbi:pyrroline-5-carboxylate reductase [Oceanobacillus limi]|uniref:Pyrroline-5-carboxylate reductase n=1 Tax=Oceanobacillus limi TaxID=930131 RepID=A0A1I0CAW9_9BACI|nr:pyrroline-5-carboxylate reductase [Oceanobacillus limi]SET16575.1 pyrroline-5-carboxylate reductase [Oceanobacillus limi]
MNKKIGFIGSGHMAEAIIGGIVQSGFARPEDVLASNRTMPKLMDVRENYGIQIAENNIDVAHSCEIVFLSVTPDKYPTVIDEIKDAIREDAIIILIAAGEGLAENEERFERKLKVVKAMPNTPVLIGEGMTSISFNEFVTEQEKEEVQALFESFGKVECIDEKLMDTASAVAGSSPAFIYMYIEALADAAVLYGMPRETAYTLAAQTVYGASKMVLETGTHPAQLKDEVCSPGGSTIQSVARLEESGFRSAIINAVKANVEKLSKND